MTTFIAGPTHPPKAKYSHNNKNICGNISLSGPTHPLKVKYVSKLILKHIGDTAYNSYISETLVLLKNAIKPRKQTRFAGNIVTSVRTIPLRKTKPHPPK